MKEFKDKISEFYADGESAGKFNPKVSVWSEMAVRAAIIKALASKSPNNRYAAAYEAANEYAESHAISKELFEFGEWCRRRFNAGHCA